MELVLAVVGLVSGLVAGCFGIRGLLWALPVPVGLWLLYWADGDPYDEGGGADAGWWLEKLPIPIAAALVGWTITATFAPLVRRS